MYTTLVVAVETPPTEAAAAAVDAPATERSAAPVLVVSLALEVPAATAPGAGGRSLGFGLPITAALLFPISACLTTFAGALAVVKPDPRALSSSGTIFFAADAPPVLSDRVEGAREAVRGFATRSAVSGAPAPAPAVPLLVARALPVVVHKESAAAPTVVFRSVVVAAGIIADAGLVVFLNTPLLVVVVTAVDSWWWRSGSACCVLGAMAAT